MKYLQKYSLLKTAAIIAASSICFLLLVFLAYRFDNKYTRQGVQPVNGMLYITEDNLEDNGVYYLVDGWSFYPDRLFTPETFEEEGYQAFVQTIAIGQYNDFSLGGSRKNTNGSATYRLVLSLPDTPHTYSLALPEIYSSYRLYVNNLSVCTLGIPESDNYSPAIGKRTITFTAFGTTQILLAVTNQSHYYSGLSYPPLFGGPASVSRTLDIQMLYRIAGLCIILIIAVAAFYLWLRERKTLQIPLLLFLSCFCLLVYTAYPLITDFVTLKTQVWYALELLCIYGMYPMVILLQNRLCHSFGRLIHFICIPMFLFSLASVWYALASPPYTKVHIIFEACSCFFKFFTAAYLLITSFLSAWNKDKKSMILLSGTTVFSISLIADRFLPVYEPVYGGWFPEYGGAYLILCLGIIILGKLTESYRLRLILSEEKHQLAKQIDMQKLHYKQLTEKVEDSMKRHHDERHHLKMICMLLENGEIERLKEYLMDYDISVASKERTIYCTNLIVDAILQFYRHQCKEKRVEYLVEAVVPSEIGISDTDLSIILGNLLENAFDASTEPGQAEPYIHVAVHYRHNNFFLRIENSVTAVPQLRDGKFISLKHNGSGIGTQSVKSTVESYNGQIKYDFTEDYFRVSLIISNCI